MKLNCNLILQFSIDREFRDQMFAGIRSIFKIIKTNEDPELILPHYHSIILGFGLMTLILISSKISFAVVIPSGGTITTPF